MRVSLLTSTLIMAISFSALVHADGTVTQRRPAPQQQQEPQYQDDYQEPQDQGYNEEVPYDQSQINIQGDVYIQNPDYRGPLVYPPTPCIQCYVNYMGNYAEVIAIYPNGQGFIAFAGNPHGQYVNSVLIEVVESMKARGSCRNLPPPLVPPVYPPCAPGLYCGGPGGPVGGPIVRPFPGPRPVPHGGVIYGNGGRRMPRPMPYR